MAAQHLFQQLRDRIQIDPLILAGKPVIRGTRIPVSLILNLLAHGASFDQIVDDYPVLTFDDIRAALLFASATLESEDAYEFVAQS